jgi:NAD(P)-dependent dehydrogenase (short-subunit alcohol dehydrogenase family)
VSSTPRKLALVTGGFRRIGAAIARRLAAAGYDLALHAHEAAEPEPELAAALEGIRWAPFRADISSAEEIETLLSAVEAEFGAPPTVLVNSAALFEDDRWDTASMECLLAHYKVNAAAPLLLATGLARRLPADLRAVVVNILDQRIANPPADQLSYTLSKQAAAGATRTLARALAPRIRVCGVAPGLTIPTPDYDGAQLERLAAMMPLGRLPSPDDIAEAVLYLVSAEAVTGQILFVDGGAALESFERDFVYLGR